MRRQNPATGCVRGGRAVAADHHALGNATLLALGRREGRYNRRNLGSVTFLLTTVVVRNIFIAAMVRQLREEIPQQKPFESLEQEAVLNVLHTADVLLQRITAVLKPFKLSHSQYNVLRILRGAGPEGLACREIGERMITRDPDITRLLDRLEARGLLTRTRDQKDRRVITARITPEGGRLLEALDQPIAEVDRQPLQHLGEQRLRTLIQLLELARDRGG
jgi:DNA-binding MarR family transcriptional regulator